MLMVSPSPLPDGLQHLDQPAPLRLTISWDDTLASTGSSSGGGDGTGGSGVGTAQAGGLQRGGSGAASMLAAAAAAAGSTGGGGSGGSGAGGGGGGGSLRHIRCRVVSDPELPEPVLAALAQELEAGRLDLFLDSLCLAGHAAAAAARQLAPEAQRAAGLLPGALRLLGTTGPAAGPAAAGSSALRLRARLQQGGRAAGLCLAFHAGGYTLLQLAPAQGATAAAASSIWLPPLWDRLTKGVPTFTAVEAAPPPGQPPGEPSRLQQHAAQQLRQAWVHHSGLAEALAQVMRAVAATAADAR